MVRYNGQVMTEIRYQELMEAQRKYSLMERANIYFFGEPDIHIVDFIFFYGIMSFCTAVTFITWLITV